jgi:hypothetical protein
MRLIRSSEWKGTGTKTTGKLAEVSEALLRQWVTALSVPRHFMAETISNETIGSWIAKHLSDFGYEIHVQGELRNIVALPKQKTDVIVVGAHYDSVPQSPGADDNASAVAAMLGCAQALAKTGVDAAVCFVAFNCEEVGHNGRGYEGSRDFVERFLPSAGFRVRHAHVLEMLGYASDAPGSQRVPTGLPIQLSDTGNFLGLLSDHRSGKVMEQILDQACSSFPSLPVIGLEVPLGMEKCLPVLARSDHVPFWEREIPAIMWTDTAEFRNPHYHKPTDTPDTLNYGFLRKATELLVSTVAVQSGAVPR